MQREMLAKYGSTLVGMDATYKTTKWGHPLFLVYVADNHKKGYHVAVMITEDETEATVTSVLRTLKAWNPGWRPAHFMLDKCDAEINSVRAVFSKTHVLLCDFHRLQAWWRWINNRDNGVPPARCEGRHNAR